ncbi:MAG: hypothetical protein P8R38_01875 [Planctomycetota bacterium]|nr:hypothetical protein [Planctomycetota bacterium]MDC0347448.1 hypothetical protein [Planctomycetota bacterium]MDG1454932.1 hypothetical protein [Planctomycetota bacterium]
MSENENLQNSVVQLVEAFEGLQSHLEQKHFGKEMEDESDFENVPEDKREALDADFREAMITVFHNLEEQNHVELVDIEAVSHILLDTLDIIAPKVEEETEVEE